MMSIQYTAIITKDNDWWLGWIEEIPGANAQERTKEELLISLKEAAKDIIELRQQPAILI
jgi:predicted RNase H-like HicB family nuclease